MNNQFNNRNPRYIQNNNPPLRNQNNNNNQSNIHAPYQQFPPHNQFQQMQPPPNNQPYNPNNPTNYTPINNQNFTPHPYNNQNFNVHQTIPNMIPPGMHFQNNANQFNPHPQNNFPPNHNFNNNQPNYNSNFNNNSTPYQKPFHQAPQQHFNNAKNNYGNQEPINQPFLPPGRQNEYPNQSNHPNPQMQAPNHNSLNQIQQNLNLLNNLNVLLNKQQMNQNNQITNHPPQPNQSNLRMNNNESATVLLVANIGEEISDKHLNLLFSSYGTVISLERVQNKKSILITMDSQQSANEVLKNLDGHFFKNTQLKIEFLNPHQPTPNLNENKDNMNKKEISSKFHRDSHTRTSEILCIKADKIKSQFINQLHFILHSLSFTPISIHLSKDKKLLYFSFATTEISKQAKELIEKKFDVSLIEYFPFANYPPKECDLLSTELRSLLPPFDTPLICEPPRDSNMHKLIDDISEKVAQNKNDFLFNFMKNPEICYNSVYQFLFGGKYSDYFRW